MCVSIEVEVRDIDKSMVRLFERLEEMKMTGHAVRLERTMMVQPRSQMPGKVTVFGTTLTVEIRVFGWCQFVRPAISPGRVLEFNGGDLADRVAFDAPEIAEFPDVVPFLKAHEEMLSEAGCWSVSGSDHVRAESEGSDGSTPFPGGDVAVADDVGESGQA